MARHCPPRPPPPPPPAAATAAALLILALPFFPAATAAAAINLGVFPAALLDLTDPATAPVSPVGYSRTDPLAPLFVQQQPQLGQLVLPPELGLATQQVQPQEGGAAAVVGKRTVVAEKRDAALLLDKIMFALKRAMKNKDGSPRAGGSGGDKQGSSFSSSGVGETVGQGGRFGGTGVVTPNDMVAFAGGGLERRGDGHGKVYWRCYFNAVSCF